MTWPRRLVAVFALGLLIFGMAGPSHAQDDEPPVIPYYRDLTWSPDGTQLAFTIISDTDSTIATYDFATATLTPLTTELPGTQDSPIWSSDSQRLAFAVHPEQNDASDDEDTDWASDLWLMNRDGSNAFPLPNTSADYELYPVEFSRDGTTLAAIGIYYDPKKDIYKSTLWLLEVDGLNRQLVQLDDSNQPYGVTYSPDGTQIAIMADGPNYDYEGVWVADIAGLSVQNATRVFEADWGLDNLAWSADGHQLLFTGDDDGAFIIFDVETRGATAVSDFMVGYTIYDPRWSPDGDHIAFAMLPSSNASLYKLWLVNPDGTKALSLAGTVAGDHSEFAWSPDATRIAFVADEWTADYEFLSSNIWVINTNGAHLTNLTAPPR